MRLDYDPEADVVYIWVRDGVPFAFNINLDDARNLSYGADEKLIGIELLAVSQGVDLTELPYRADVARLLADAHLPGWDTT